MGCLLLLLTLWNGHVPNQQREGSFLCRKELTTHSAVPLSTSGSTCAKHSSLNNSQFEGRRTSALLCLWSVSWEGPASPFPPPRGTSCTCWAPPGGSGPSGWHTPLSSPASSPGSAHASQPPPAASCAARRTHWGPPAPSLEDRNTNRHKWGHRQTPPSMAVKRLLS